MQEGGKEKVRVRKSLESKVARGEEERKMSCG